MRHTLLITMLTMVYHLVDAQEINQDLLHGRWNFDLAKSIALQTSYSQQLYDRIPIDFKKNIENEMTQRWISFDSTGIYHSYIESTDFSGTWRVLGDGVTVSIELSNGDSYNQRILELYSNSLVIQLHEEADSTALFHYWHLTKE